MALTTSTEFTIRASATTGNVNGAGFNPKNANMLTNLTATTNTANTATPELSSASYNFVAGDVGHWVYIKSGTNWTPGWYQIDSVASNKATVNAAIGSAQQTSNGFKKPSTVVGCATVGTPTNGTFCIDYSQSNTAIISGSTDFTAVGSSTNLTSATGGFTNVMVGNFFHQTTTGTGGFGIVGWYEIVSYTNGNTVVLDRTPNTGTTSVACTGYVGGAGRLNALEDAFGEVVPSGSNVWIQNGTYSISGSINTSASSNGTSEFPISYIGFDAIPGDDPTGSTRPLLACGANTLNFSSYTFISFISITGTGTTLLTIPASGFLKCCKIHNTSSTVLRTALSSSSASVYFSEIISQNGNCLGTLGRYYGCYFHDSTNGISAAITGSHFNRCIFASLSTSGFNSTSASGLNNITSCTFYGRSSTPTGTAIGNTAASIGNRYLNNIISGFATGILVTTTNSLSNTGLFNNFYNNTTDVTLFTKDSTDTSFDPQFTDTSEITISNGTATGGTNVLSSSGADFSSVEDNVDFVRILSHTGGTGTFIANYLITAHTTTTLTLNNNMGTSGSATSIVAYIPTGHNYGVGANLEAKEFPGLFVGSDTTSYGELGAVESQSSGGGGGGYGASLTFAG